MRHLIILTWNFSIKAKQNHAFLALMIFNYWNLENIFISHSFIFLILKNLNLKDLNLTLILLISLLLLWKNSFGSRFSNLKYIVWDLILERKKNNLKKYCSALTHKEKTSTGRLKTWNQLLKGIVSINKYD